MDVPARELKLRLGRYLRIARSGKAVRVTHRGKPIVELRPVAGTGDSPLQALVASGQVRPGSGRLAPHAPVPAIRSGSTVILEERESERT